MRIGSGKTLLSLVAMALTASSCGDKAKVNDINNGIEITLSDGISTRVMFYSPNTVRCTKWADGAKEIKSLVVTKEAEHVDYSRYEDENSAWIKTDSIIVVVSKANGNVTYLTADSTEYLRETSSGMKAVEIKGDKGYATELELKISEDEAIYGFGQNQNYVMNYRGKKVELVQSNTNAVNPVMISTNGYGLMWDNYSYTTFEETDNTIAIKSKMGSNIDYYVMKGSTADRTISEYRNLTGKAVMLPKWAFGYWQSKERYKTQDELLAVATRYRNENIPIDCMVQDWEWWEPGKWSGMEFDTTRFANPKAMMDQLHAMNMHAIISVWPCVGLDAPMHDDMYSKGYLYEPIGWGNFRYVDVYNPGAMKLYNDYVYKNVYPQGFDGWWHDSTEPDVTNSLTKDAHQYETERLENCYLGSQTRYLNTYVLTLLDNVYDKWTATDNRRACILTRSAFAGLQRDGAITWSGDIGASWQIYREQITAGLNFCLSGIPYWSFDIGGFLIGSYDGLFTYGAKDPSYMELYTRMFQFATFSPVFRSHGSDAPREMWEMGEYKNVLVEFDKLRYRMMPYIYSLAGRTYTEDYTMMRALAMDFASDKKTLDIKDEYMFGDNILVAPVTDYMYHTPPQISHMVPAEVFRTNDGKQGIDVKYYNDLNFSSLTKEEKAENVDVYWYSGRPDYVTDSVYSIRWEGKVVAPETGKYQFQIKSFDSRVIIFNGDTLKIALDCNEPYFEFIELEAGKEYPIICETQNHQTGAARFRLYWKTPSDFAKEGEKATREKTREVYLPKGAGWVDFWTNKRYNGGETVKMDAPIEKMPLLVKQGSILPMGPVVQYANERPDAPLDIRVYVGADGKFTLYEDEGDNMNYKDGAYSTIDFTYSESEKKLTISDRQGSYKDMPRERLFRIIKVTEGNTSLKPSTTISYTGEKTEIKL
ncbi:MAG: DUF5110 domain-containing protein [Bacteroidales bacterium]|nr:DUF5110 domain-containing protein [Bacteroidales bacterium]